MRGYDGGKKINGRKRVTLCDMAGNFLDAIVRPANWGERLCALDLLIQVKRRLWRKNIQVVFADNGFSGAGFGRQIQNQGGVRLEIVSREPDSTPGFQVVRKRWLIEQVFGCWGRNRRLSRDYEMNPNISRATLQAASVHRFLRRLKPIPGEFPPFRYRTQSL